MEYALFQSVFNPYQSIVRVGPISLLNAHLASFHIRARRSQRQPKNSPLARRSLVLCVINILSTVPLFDVSLAHFASAPRDHPQTRVTPGSQRLTRSVDRLFKCSNPFAVDVSPIGLLEIGGSNIQFVLYLFSSAV